MFEALTILLEIVYYIRGFYFYFDQNVMMGSVARRLNLFTVMPGSGKTRLQVVQSFFDQQSNTRRNRDPCQCGKQFTNFAKILLICLNIVDQILKRLVLPHLSASSLLIVKLLKRNDFYLVSLSFCLLSDCFIWLSE